MNETEAARVIQQTWRAFAMDRRQVADEARTIARQIGHPVACLDDYYLYQADGKIMVQINGRADDPTVGHSCFIVDYAFWHLIVGNRQLIGPLVEGAFSRFPLAQGAHAGEYAGISCNGFDVVMDDYRYLGKINLMIGKEALFVIDADCTQHFQPAFHAERVHFVAAPYAYGLHYNCNTLVRNVLRRMMRLAGR